MSAFVAALVKARAGILSVLMPKISPRFHKRSYMYEEDLVAANSLLSLRCLLFNGTETP